jgi:hypothetical protein
MREEAGHQVTVMVRHLDGEMFGWGDGEMVGL